jgi:hypothetical protein
MDQLTTDESMFLMAASIGDKKLNLGKRKDVYPWEDRLSIELQGLVTTVYPREDRLSIELQGLVTTVYPWEDRLSIELQGLVTTVYTWEDRLSIELQGTGFCTTS